MFCADHKVFIMQCFRSTRKCTMFLTPCERERVSEEQPSPRWARRAERGEDSNDSTMKECSTKHAACSQCVSGRRIAHTTLWPPYGRVDGVCVITYFVSPLMNFCPHPLQAAALVAAWVKKILTTPMSLCCKYVDTRTLDPALEQTTGCAGVWPETDNRVCCCVRG